MVSDIDKLRRIHAELRAVRGEATQEGQTPSVNELLDEFDATLEHMTSAREARNRLVSEHCAFLALLELLSENSQPLCPDKLYCLIEPHVDRLGQQIEALEAVMG